MKKDYSARLGELEYKMQIVTSQMFTLCEERIRAARAKPSPLLLALAASALAVKKTAAVFFAIARMPK